MAAINEITGDAIRSRDSEEYAKKFDAIDWESPMDAKKPLEIGYCQHCHIRVSTFSGKCPCCGRDLK
jgi:hypothetical protein